MLIFRNSKPALTAILLSLITLFGLNAMALLDSVKIFANEPAIKWADDTIERLEDLYRNENISKEIFVENLEGVYRNLEDKYNNGEIDAESFEQKRDELMGLIHYLEEM